MANVKMKISIKVDDETTIDGLMEYDPATEWKLRTTLIRQCLAAKRNYIDESKKEEYQPSWIADIPKAALSMPISDLINELESEKK